MKKKKHPMQPPYENGDVFAVQFDEDAWGYCRMWSGMGIEVATVFTRVAGLPSTRWAPAVPPKWLFRINLAVSEPAQPVVVPVGAVRFASDEDAIMPPTYREPDSMEPRYTIEERGIYRYTSDPADLVGISKERWLTPAKLGSFLRDRYQEGELKETTVNSNIN